MSPQSTVLLLSDDAMTLTLLGLLVELANFTPAFAADGERPEDAMARVRPSLVVLLDDTLQAVHSDMFFARAAQRRIALAVFPGRGSRREFMESIGERGIPWFDLPTDAATLTSILRAAAATHWWARGSDRRALPAAERPDAGGLFFVDRAGRRWQVYDRRGSDRRQTPDGGTPGVALPNGPHGGPAGDADAEAAITRLFVSDDGASIGTELASEEVAALSAADLERQFLRSKPVG
jgi:hypothetical protein